MILTYNTRDEKGNEILKEVEIKQFKKYDINFVCPICHKEYAKLCKAWPEIRKYV